MQMICHSYYSKFLLYKENYVLAIKNYFTYTTMLHSHVN